MIFISGYAPDSVRLDGATTPAMCLAKPFSASMLGAKIREALELTRASLVTQHHPNRLTVEGWS